MQTPEEKIMHTLLLQAIQKNYIPQDVIVTPDNVADLYEEYYDYCQDLMYEFREGEVETSLPCDYSRHYESQSVAAKMYDDSWVGWTYWYGGGKHGEPEAIDWMEDAYQLNCVEEEKLVIVQTFTKVA